MEDVIALLALTAMEIVLGIDNIVFIAILTDRLPRERQSLARKLGLLLALGSRIVLLCTIKWIIGLTQPLFVWTDAGLPAEWFVANAEHTAEAAREMLEVSWRDLILLGGGLFLIGKTVHEIHGQLEGGHGHEAAPARVSFGRVLVQIALLDVVFSLDSVITAVGMADRLEIMIGAVVLSMAVMIVFADRISRFISQHPSLKMLALSFLMLIGVLLVSESIGTHVNKGYVYFAMAFSLGIELLNIRVRHVSTAQQAAANLDD